MYKYRQKLKTLEIPENAIASAQCTHQNFLEELHMLYKQRLVNLSFLIRNVEVRQVGRAIPEEDMGNKLTL